MSKPVPGRQRRLYLAGAAHTLPDNLRRLALRLLLRLVRRAPDYPSFWVTPRDFVSRGILVKGYYERELLFGIGALFRDRERRVAVDAGANVGNHTVYFAGLFDRVVAFEPNPRVARLLEANIDLNRLRNVTVVRKGLGAQAGSLPFYERDPDNLGAGGFRAAVPGGPQAELGIVRGDEALAELGVRREVSLIKMDIEGMEPEALRGLGQTLAESRPIVIFEANSAEVQRICLAILRAANYGFFYELTTRHARQRWTNRLLDVVRRGTYLRTLVPAGHDLRGLVVAAPEPLLGEPAAAG